ncbi:MAG TPA: tetratricopeptide repeat protein [Acidisoma sp.]|jgi:TolA-binding protein|uniref:tetratricopeptide repeat protein n=1 Tax=Acidisoma sp. TaxID=1872115 RepID=UPI002CD020CC|nr:tetratricopeptide repeat protein [Acidisoma sp.]HTI01990.1 tetratricopeptide repeat protein [Acidisoma sp.]
MKKTLLAGLSASALCLLLLSGPARAQDASVTSREGIALQNQILSLQNQMQQLQASVQQVQANGGGGGGGRAPAENGSNGDLTAQLLQRVGTLEQQVRDLTGQLQQLQNQVNTQNAQLNKQLGDITFQMQNGGAAPGAAPAAPASEAPPPGPAKPAAGAVAAATPEALMQQGVLALHQGNFKTSEGVAREILAKHRTSPRAYDAQFLLAQSLQGQQRYQEAALAFDDTYNMNHKGSKAPSALLGLATTLSAINQKAAACDTLKTLHTQFPKPPSYLVQPIASAHKKLGC